MKTFKRNAVIITVLVFVVAAAYLNWSYGKKAGGQDEDIPNGVQVTDGAEVIVDGDGDEDGDSGDIDNAGGESGSAGLYYEGSGAQALARETAEYFDGVRLSRSQARDSAKATLVTVTETDGASQEMVDEALAKIAQMAEYTILESEIETLIKAKGFTECIAYISESGVTVTVTPQTAEGLSTAAVAKITDVITEKTPFTAENLNIVPIK